MRSISFKFLFSSCVFLLACSNADVQDSEIKLSNEEESVAVEMKNWQAEKEGDYPHREEMLDDVMNDEGLRAMEKNELIERLGRPDRVNEDYVYYTVKQKRLGFFPLHTKSLVIKFHTNGPVEWMKIHE